MRIACTGKGGSGKTTILTLFSAIAAQDGYTVLALDADINQHVAAAFDISKPLPSMGNDIGMIKHYLAGSRLDIAPEVMHKTTPPCNLSRFVTTASDDWFMNNYTVKTDYGVSVAGAGEIPEGNIGVKCYHGLNGAVELVLGHMIDAQDDIVAVDMTAGADAFSSSLFTKVDALVLVVEPTLKSLSVYDQFKPHAKEYGIPLFVVANKIEHDDDLEFITQYVDEIAAVIPLSGFVRRKEQGRAAGFLNIEPKVRDALVELRGTLLSIPRDWDEMQRKMDRMHARVIAADKSNGGSTTGNSFSLKDTATRLLS